MDINTHLQHKELFIVRDIQGELNYTFVADDMDEIMLLLEIGIQAIRDCEVVTLQFNRNEMQKELQSPDNPFDFEVDCIWKTEDGEDKETLLFTIERSVPLSMDRFM